MALIGTISGSVGAGNALTSNNAITGTLVIADTTENFPTIASDAVLFVSGNINGGSKAVIGGDLVVSGTTKTLSDLTFSGSNFYIGGNVSFENDILFLDKANSRVGIGTSSPDSDLTLRSSNTTNIRGVSGLHYDNSTAFSQFKFIGGRARGSTGSPAAVQADDSLASFNGRGYKTTGWSNTVGGLYIYAKEAWTDSSTPTYITFRGVAAGAGTTVSEWAKLESTGLTVTQNITGSNALFTGDIAVNGGDITTTAATANIFTNLASSLSIGGTTPGITIGTSTGQTTVNIATGGATVGSVTTPKTVNIGTNTSGTAAVFVNVGSEKARPGNARITLHNEVHLTSGTLVGSPGGVNNELTLVSSGSVVVRLDTNNDGPGHRFEIRDWSGGTEFAVSETGDAEIAGNLLITGSSLSTQTTTTFSLLTTALTGTLNVASLASIVNVGGSITTSSFVGDIGVVGRTNVSTVVEKLINSNGSTGTVSFDLGSQGIFYVNNPAGNITANFINVPTGTNRVITPTVILSQSATTPRTITALQIDGAVQTINWANGVTPTVTGNRQEVFGFSLIRSGSGASAVWKVLGQMSSYG